MVTWTADRRRRYAIARANERRRQDLVPPRAEIAGLIARLGWRRARPIIETALGRPITRRGLWTLTKRPTMRVLKALRTAPYQPTLWTTRPSRPLVITKQPTRERN